MSFRQLKRIRDQRAPQVLTITHSDEEEEDSLSSTSEEDLEDSWDSQCQMRVTPDTSSPYPYSPASELCCQLLDFPIDICKKKLFLWMLYRKNKMVLRSLQKFTPNPEFEHAAWQVRKEGGGEHAPPSPSWTLLGHLSSALVPCQGVPMLMWTRVFSPQPWLVVVGVCDQHLK